MCPCFSDGCVKRRVRYASSMGIFRQHRCRCSSFCLFSRHFSLSPVTYCAPCLNRSMDLDAIWQVHLWGPVRQSLMGSPTLRCTGDLGVKPLTKTWNCELQPNSQSYAATWWIQTRSWVDLPQWFRLLPSYFGLRSVIKVERMHKVLLFYHYVSTITITTF